MIKNILKNTLIGNHLQNLVISKTNLMRSGTIKIIREDDNLSQSDIDSILGRDEETSIQKKKQKDQEIV